MVLGLDRLVISQVEGLSILANRYKDMKIMNIDIHSGEQRGCFSLVFRAFDTIEKKHVALKFYSPSKDSDPYRKISFKREYEILRGLISQNRCLQLLSGFEVFDINISHSGISYSHPVQYFAVEWIEDGIDDYFLGKGVGISSVDRLKLFRDIVLAVSALHRNDIFHRDLKADNLRRAVRSLQEIVVAIDLGTAARLESDNVKSDYAISVGAQAYAAPESLCGGAGIRCLAAYTDIYALGCLLFELFNPDYYYIRLLDNNAHYNYLENMLAAEVSAEVSDADKISALQKFLNAHALSVSVIDINGPGSIVPPSVVNILNNLLVSLVRFDYRQRCVDYNKILSAISSAIRVLENQDVYNRRREYIRKMKEIRRLKAARLPVSIINSEDL